MRRMPAALPVTALVASAPSSTSRRGAHQRDVAQQEGQAGQHLAVGRVAVAGRAPGDEVGDQQARPVEPDAGQHAVEQLAGRADEGLAERGLPRRPVLRRPASVRPRGCRRRTPGWWRWRPAGSRRSAARACAQLLARAGGGGDLLGPQHRPRHAAGAPRGAAAAGGASAAPAPAPAGRPAARGKTVDRRLRQAPRRLPTRSATATLPARPCATHRQTGAFAQLLLPP